MDLTGGGAFYSLAPRRDLADLHRVGLNESPLRKGANKGSFCKGAGAKHLRIFNQDILRPSAEIFSANLTPNAQNDHLKSPLPPLLVCSRLTGLRARLTALTLRPQLASRFTKGGKKVAFTLAEGATHVDTFHDIRKPAFTLAEVLVTLGIIGIVAAMTLPMLAKNYQFYVRQQQFKKAYAAMSVAIQKTQIDMGEGIKCHYVNGVWDFNAMIDCEWFYDELMKNLVVLKFCEDNALEKGCIPKEMKTIEDLYLDVYGQEISQETLRGCGGFSKNRMLNNSPVYIFNSGFSIIIYDRGYQTQHHSHIFLLDINAHKGPNKWGHDIFAFKFNKKSKRESVFKLEPMDGCFAPQSGGYYTTHFFDYLYGRNSEL